MPFFDVKEPSRNCHTIGMTQYFVCNFANPDSPMYVSTYDVTSCIVVLFKNLDENQRCSNFAMVHLNLTNVYFEDLAEKNLAQVIRDFEEMGGDLRLSSIEILGGLVQDPNDTCGKIIKALQTIAEKRSISKLKIEIPEDYKLRIAPDDKSAGNYQVMSLACSKLGTTIRKAIIKDNKLERCVFYPPDSEVLSSANINNILHVEAREVARLRTKTKTFFGILTFVRATEEPETPRYKYLVTQLQKKYCEIEKSIFPVDTLCAPLPGLAMP